MSHQLFFFRQFRENFFHIGAALPSSKFTGQAMTAHLAQKSGPVNVLEVGAGTGAFTNEIIPLLEQGDRLDVIEINPNLLGYLKHRLEGETFYQNSQATINFINSDVRHLAYNKSYDYVVFALPMVNFPPDLTQEILTLMMKLLKPGGVLSYITYIFVSRIKFAFSQAETQEIIRKNQRTIREFAQQYQIGQRPVVRNLPPAWVVYWQKP